MNLRVERIPSLVGKQFIIKHHYSHGVHNGPMTWGLFDGDELVGVCAFATPASEAACSSIFGPDHRRSVTELHRLVILDHVPHGTASWFLKRALDGLKRERPNYQAVVSFADATQGHLGTVYQACSALYTGRSGRATFYVDADGRLRHPRQNGINISKEEARLRGWKPVKREGKYRYLFLLGSGRQKRKLRRMLLLDVLPYPKNDLHEQQ